MHNENNEPEVRDTVIYFFDKVFELMITTPIAETEIIISENMITGEFKPKIIYPQTFKMNNK